MLELDEKINPSTDSCGAKRYTRINIKENLHRNYFDLIFEENITLADGYEYFTLKYRLNSEIKIDWLVKLFENPVSPFRLAGSIELFNHDLLHCILNRGIKAADEAFVIGYTMASVKNVSKNQLKLFKFISKHIYRKPYKLNDTDLKEFDRACFLAQNNPRLPELNKVRLKEKLNHPIKDILSEYGIVIEKTNHL